MPRKEQYNIGNYEKLSNTKSFERCKFYLVKRCDSDKYVDLVMDCDGFVFLLQPKEFYSNKTQYVFSKMLHALAQGRYDNEENRATR